MKSNKTGDQFTTISCKQPTRNWYGWNDLMPPGPVTAHVVGEVQVPNPGVIAKLVPHVPQGINPAIKLLDLVLIQRPGIWPMVLTWVNVHYSEETGEPVYKQADVLCDGGSIALVDLEDVH